ncbi:MAG: glycosyltransferase family 4 protein, partial [Desulfobacteraceae bacterium]|nr:glycosyltransferase family 4 protein [Desulfobacteraceae bacterium]
SRNTTENNYSYNTNSAKRYTIPNFVDTDKYFPQDKKESRTELKLPKNSFIVATVGAINKHHKRMHYFIEEMARLEHETDTSFHALIVGAKDLDTGEIINLARKKLGGRVTILLDLPRNRMADVYNASDAFVLCSLREAFGIVLIEAMACGLPVMCHKYPILEWVVQEGGECIDMTKKDNLASLLKIYSGDKKLRSKKGESGRNRVLHEFSKEVVVSKTIEMYESIISKSSNERFSQKGS